jgi:uncharacterized protein
VIGIGPKPEIDRCTAGFCGYNQLALSIPVINFYNTQLFPEKTLSERGKGTEKMSPLDSLGKEERALRLWTLGTALALGIAAVLLARLGNPPNMGICAACFMRDTAGGLALFSKPAGLQYLRPEIPAFLLGSVAATLLFREFRSRGGSSPIIRFVIGAFIMIGALVFLGCPIRLIVRIGGGDWSTAGSGLLGLLAGIGFAVFCIRRGFDLGPGRDLKPMAALMLPLLTVGLVVFILFLAFGTGGDPRGLLQTKWKAPVLISLAVAFVIGFMAQRSRYCTTGGIRDLILWRKFRLFNAYLVFLATVVAGNLLVDALCPGERKLFDWGAAPIAHGEHLWNFLGLFLVGLGSVLVSGCPFRQLVAAGQGNSDAAITIFGLLFGAAFCHNFGLAAKPGSADAAGGPGTAGMFAVVIGIVIVSAIGFFCRDRGSEG